MNFRQLQTKLAEHSIIMPLPWTELRTDVFCCFSCVGSELQNFADRFNGAVFFCEQSSPNAMIYMAYGRLYRDESERSEQLEEAFAQQLFGLLQSCSLTVEWDGSTATKMRVGGIDTTDFEKWLDANREDDYDEYEDEDEAEYEDAWR